MRVHDALAPVDHDGHKLHDARCLYEWLGVGRSFANWFRKVVSDYEFNEGSDYWPKRAENTGQRGKPRKDYLMTATMAKEVAMIGNTSVGRETRRYFIRMEAAAVEMANTE